MRPYEAMVVLRPALEEAALETILTRLQSVITDQGGEVTHIDQWGKRRLAYVIDDHIEGFYVVIKFKGNAGITTEMERVMRISDAVLRFLVVRDEIPVAVPAQTADETVAADSAEATAETAAEDSATTAETADASAGETAAAEAAVDAAATEDATEAEATEADKPAEA